MLCTILPSLEEIPKGIWRGYLGESREGYNDKYEYKYNVEPCPEVVEPGWKTRKKPGGYRTEFQVRSNTKPAPEPDTKPDTEYDSRAGYSGWQENTRYRWAFLTADESFHGNTWETIAYYHLGLWLPGFSFPWSVFVEGSTVRIPPLSA